MIKLFGYYLREIKISTKSYDVQPTSDK